MLSPLEMLTSQRKKFANSYSQNLTWTIRIQASHGPRVVGHHCKPKHTCLWETIFFVEWHHNPGVCACISGWKFHIWTKLSNLHTCCSQEAHCSASNSWNSLLGHFSNGFYFMSSCPGMCASVNIDRDLHMTGEGTSENWQYKTYGIYVGSKIAGTTNLPKLDFNFAYWKSCIHLPCVHQYQLQILAFENEEHTHAQFFFKKMIILLVLGTKISTTY
jgi:hypothetical protein